MTDTLAYHKNRPLLAPLDLSSASLVHVVDGFGPMKDMLKDEEGYTSIAPESEALWFYLQNHAMSIVSQNLDVDEPLGKYAPFVEQYHADMQRKTLRMFYYLLLICTRESRHAGSGPGRDKLYKKYPNIKEFHATHIQDTSEIVVIKNMLAEAPDVTLGEYTNFLVDAFQFPSYESMFGGAAWKKVATPLRDFVHGTITAEMLMDTAFTLAHNNGPIFNKGMVFNSVHTISLNKILDVQRSGQIPQLVTQAGDVNKFVLSEMTAYVRAFTKVVGASFGGSVDWTKVKDIYGHACYTNEIQDQKKTETGVDIIEYLKAKAKVVKQVFLESVKNKHSVEIMPGVFVLKGKRSMPNE